MSLSQFSRGLSAAGPDRSSRVAAGLLTAGLYVLFAGLIWWSLSHPRARQEMIEITAAILPDTRSKRAEEPLPPFLARLIRPRAEKPALPSFTIAAGAPPQAPAPLAATTRISPIPGSTSGAGPMGQAASGNGTGGNGGALAGCIDADWMRAVSERVRQFFYYPDEALATRATGVVLVHFAIRADGHIDRLEIARSSGNAGLDRAAIDIVQKAQPLPPIPERMHTDRVEGELPVNFGMRRYTGGASKGSC